MASYTKDIELAASYIREGKLAAFPTETVYGLGADCLNPVAVANIFKAKDRPFNDPLICHIYSKEQAYALFDFTPEVEAIFNILADAFWPGPLTMVTTALPHVPTITMGGGNTVGVRCPRHPIARELIRLSDRAIAAPSANRFGHVSPTTAKHVMDDLSHAEDLLIIENDESTPVEIGIESSVVKLAADHVEFFRLGGVSIEEVREVLPASIEVFYKQKANKTNRQANAAPEMAPGQLLRHYAPDVPASCVNNDAEEVINMDIVSSSVIIDYQNLLAHLQDKALLYISLGMKPAEASFKLFDALRTAELVDGATKILLADPRLTQDDSRGITAMALYDRIFRATEGRCCKIN